MNKKIKIINCVGVGMLNESFYLPTLHSQFLECGIEARYEPRRFRAVVVRVPQLCTTYLVFAEGKLVATGYTVPGGTQYIMESIVNCIKRLPAAEPDDSYSKLELVSYEVRNIVCRIDDFMDPLCSDRFIISRSISTDDCEHEEISFDSDACEAIEELAKEREEAGDFKGSVISFQRVFGDEYAENRTAILFPNGSALLIGFDDISEVERAAMQLKQHVERD